MNKLQDILNKKELQKEDIIFLLEQKGENQKQIFRKSQEIKEKYLGKVSYFRGLIEFSNVCYKNCLYCGIRAGNKNANRYTIGEKNILKAAQFAYDNNFGSIVLQSGEREDQEFIDFVDQLLQKIKKLSKGKLGITISLGEQKPEVYKRWFESGTHRYLLRIEASNEDLYYKIHPQNNKHNYQRRRNCLQSLQNIGYQTGTGGMVGLPFQTYEHLAEDLLFYRDFDIDMVGMGPYIEHKDTPLWKHRHLLMPLEKRFSLTLNMIAVLRIMMPDINIAAATALQAIDPVGRERALKIGANVIMPNITPTINRKDYLLYQNKPCTDEGADECVNCLEARISLAGDEIGYGQWGDSKHYYKRRNMEKIKEN